MSVTRENFIVKGYTNKPQQDLEDCFNEGYAAYYDNQEDYQNPYNGLEGEWWSDGWEDASDEDSSWSFGDSAVVHCNFLVTNQHHPIHIVGFGITLHHSRTIIQGKRN